LRGPSPGKDTNAMHDTGPALDILTRRLAECPGDLLGEPRIGGQGSVHVEALVYDTIRDLGGTVDSPRDLDRYRSAESNRRNELRLVMLCTWLLHDSWFVAARRYAPQARELFDSGLTELAALVNAEKFVSDPDRREELVRLCLAALDLRPAGESESHAEDRLKTLNSVERVRLIRATQESQMRARKLREEMRRKKAAEAAAKASREW